MAKSTATFNEDARAQWTKQQQDYSSQFLARMETEYTKALKKVSENPNFKASFSEITPEDVLATISLIVDNLDTVLEEISRAISSFGVSLAIFAAKSLWAFIKKRKVYQENLALVKNYMNPAEWNKQVHVLAEYFTTNRKDALSSPLNTKQLMKIAAKDADTCLAFIRCHGVPGDFNVEEMWRQGW